MLDPSMRATRGLMASLGAGTALVLAAAAALFSVSTIVAFRGWPGVDAPGVGSDPTAIAVASSLTDADLAARRIVVPASRSMARKQAGASGATHLHGGPTVASRPSVAVRGRLPESSHAPTSKATPAPGPRVRDETVTAGDPVREVGTGVGNAVGEVTGGLGEAVRPVSPALGRTLDGAGRGVEQTVGGVTRGVGTTLDTLLSGPPGG